MLKVRYRKQPHGDKPMLNWKRTSAGLVFTDNNGNIVMTTYWNSDGTWEARPALNCAGLATVVLYSIKACEWYALCCHQTLTDTGH